MPKSQTSNQDVNFNTSVVFPSAQPITAASLPLPTGASVSAKQPALGTAGTPSADVITIQGVTGMTPVQFTQVESTTGTLSSAPAAITTSVVLASNAARKGYILYNDSTSVCKIAFAATASLIAFSDLLNPDSSYEPGTYYNGVISAIWIAASGNMRVTEFT